jgi:biotin carboxyl carrier protein
MKTYNYIINSNKYEVTIDSVEDGKAKVLVNGAAYDVQTDEAEIVATPAPVKVERPVEEPKYPVETAKSSSGWAAVTPLPGTIVDVLVSKGDLVKKGQTLVILEAMKMENQIESEVDGVVAEVSVSKGDTVLEGEKIVVLD